MREYDDRLSRAVSAFESTVQDTAIIREVRDIIERGLQASADWWALTASGASTEEQGQSPTVDIVEPAVPAEERGGDVDGELRRLRNCSRIQRALTRIVDKMELDNLADMMLQP